MAIEVLMPRQGQSVESCIIVSWKVKEGTVVKKGDPLCDVETDKAIFEVESPADGTVLGIFYPEESNVEVLKVIAVVGEPNEDISNFIPVQENSSPPPTENKQPLTVSPTPTRTDTMSENTIEDNSLKISPRARNLALKTELDFSAIKGSGPQGRIIEQDIKQALTTRPPLTPAAIERLKTGDVQAPSLGTGIGGRILLNDLIDKHQAPHSPLPFTTHPIKGIRKVIAERMLESLQTTAQVTLNASANAESLLHYRSLCKAAPENTEVNNLNLNDYILYVVAKTLFDFPELNAHCLKDEVICYKDVNLGFAVDTPRGLLVPVIKKANHLSLRQIANEAKSLAVQCLKGTINPDVLSGATFTVSNLGAMGIESFTPILNPPEVAILGVGSIQVKPLLKNDNLEFVPHLGLSLTFNHCAIDGYPAAKFLVALCKKLEAFEFELTLNY